MKACGHGLAGHSEGMRGIDQHLVGPGFPAQYAPARPGRLFMAIQGQWAQLCRWRCCPPWALQ